MYKISTREFVEMVLSGGGGGGGGGGGVFGNVNNHPPPPPPDVLQTLLVVHLFRRTLGIMGRVYWSLSVFLYPFPALRKALSILCHGRWHL